MREGRGGAPRKKPQRSTRKTTYRLKGIGERKRFLFLFQAFMHACMHARMHECLHEVWYNTIHHDLAWHDPAYDVNTCLAIAHDIMTLSHHIMLHHVVPYHKLMLWCYVLQSVYHRMQAHDMLCYITLWHAVLWHGMPSHVMSGRACRDMVWRAITCAKLG
jgi:hypothetical protein